MPANNLWRRFQRLIPQDPILYAEVTSVHQDGRSTVELPGGALLRVRGDGYDTGTPVYIQSRRILEEAPALEYFEATV